MHDSPSQLAAAEIRAAMARQGKKQTQLVAALGRNADWWSKRLLGKQPLSVDDLVAIAGWLEIDITAFLPTNVAA